MQKKILQIGKFFPPDWGGIETATVGNIEVFEEIKGWHLDTIVHSNREIIKSSQSVLGFKFRLIGNIPVSYDLLKFVKRKMADYSCVIVHVPNPIPLVLAVLKKKDQKFCLYWHAPISKKGVFATFLYNFFTRVFYRHFDYILLPTTAHIETLPSYLKNKEKYIVDLYSTTELKEQATHISNIQSTSNADVKNPYFVCTGRFVEYKGFDVAIAAFSVFLKKYPEVQLVMIGSGIEFEKYKTMIQKLGIQGSVVFFDNLSNYAKIKKISEAICLLMPSTTNQEMYGLAQIEAFASGTPVITTNLKHSGVPIVANASGGAIIVSPSSVTQLTEAMEEIYKNDSFRQNLSKKSKKYFDQAQAVKSIADQFEAFLVKVAD